MAKRIPGIRIVGGVHDKVAAATEQVADRQQISVGSVSIQCIETPFHTQGHICYLCSEEGSSEQLIFTGDTLFIGGCGRCRPPQQHAFLYTTNRECTYRMSKPQCTSLGLVTAGHSPLDFLRMPSTIGSCWLPRQSV